MWMRIPFVMLVALASSGCCMQLTMTPDVVVPGLNPDFYLLCSIPSSTTEKVVSITFSRITAFQMNQRPEALVSLEMRNPSRPMVHSQVTKKVHATGFLPGFNSLGVDGHLHVTWHNPGLDDMGLYFCQADIMHRSGAVASRSKAIVVSSADANVQRAQLLRQIEDQIHAIYKQYFKEQQARVTTAAPTTTPAVQTTQPPTTTTTTTTTTTPAPTTTTTTATTTTQPPTTTYRILWPTTPRQTAEPTEVVEGEGFDVVEDFFTYGNNTYFFVNSSMPKIAEDAMTMCEDAGMTLAYIPSQSIYEKLRTFFAALLPPQESMLLSLRGPRRSWSWPYKGDRVFLTLHLNTGTEMQQCLAITSTGATDTTLTLVPCTNLFQYYVCSLPQNIMA